MELTVLLIGFIILAGFIKGFVGFGLSLILITALLQAGFESTELLPILVPLFVILDLFLFYENRKHVKLNFKENFPLHPTTLISLFLGILIGTYLLLIIDTSFLKLAFAIVVLVLIFLMLEKIDMHQMKTPSEKENGFFGFSSGILTGMFTLNAVPTTLYLLYHQYPKEKYMGALVTFLIISDVILIGVYLFTAELFTLSGLVTSGKLLLLVLIGFFIGSFLRRQVNTSKFKAIVILILAVNSIKIIFDYFFN